MVTTATMVTMATMVTTMPIAAASMAMIRRSMIKYHISKPA